ncbi:hypothetical protein SPARK1531C2_05646 [Klebsiella grimontii]|nr:hypothetical protein SPARK1531C2_05646 [Klebsiella grimontii]
MLLRFLYIRVIFPLKLLHFSCMTTHYLLKIIILLWVFFFEHLTSLGQNKCI